MSTRVMTLFGEEIIPEPQKTAPKARAKKSEETLPVTAPEPTPGEVKVTSSAPEEPIFAIEEALPEAKAEATPEEAEVTIPSPEEPIAARVKQAKKPKKEIADEKTELTEPADIIPEDWKGEKKYYTIGEVAGFFKVKTSHIRFWTNEFKLKVRTTRKGDRLFSPEQVKELRAIYHLVKERGFTLSGAKTKLKTQNKRDVVTVDLKTSLQQLRSKLVILRDQLD